MRGQSDQVKEEEEKEGRRGVGGRELRKKTQESITQEGEGARKMARKGGGGRGSVKSSPQPERAKCANLNLSNLETQSTKASTTYKTALS